MSEVTEAMPCPFCGGEADFSDGEDYGIFQLGCVVAEGDDRCSARPFVNGANRADAIARWNTRAALAAQPSAPAKGDADVALDLADSIHAIACERAPDASCQDAIAFAVQLILPVLTTAREAGRAEEREAIAKWHDDAIPRLEAENTRIRSVVPGETGATARNETRVETHRASAAAIRARGE